MTMRSPAAPHPRQYQSQYQHQQHRNRQRQVLLPAEIPIWTVNWMRSSQKLKRITVLPIDHPNTLLAGWSLASDMRLEGDFRDSVEVLRGIWEKYRMVLGDDLPATLLAATSLAVSLRIRRSRVGRAWSPAWVRGFGSARSQGGPLRRIVGGHGDQTSS